MQPYLWQFFVMAFAGWVNRFQQDATPERRESAHTKEQVAQAIDAFAKVGRKHGVIT